MTGNQNEKKIYVCDGCDEHFDQRHKLFQHTCNIDAGTATLENCVIGLSVGCTPAPNGTEPGRAYFDYRQYRASIVTNADASMRWASSRLF